MSKIDSWITKIPRLKNSKVARFSYRAEAYANDEIEGVSSYDYAQDMNVPLATHTDFDPDMLSIGARTNFSSVPKNGLNHFFGRVSYNLNKVIDFLSDFLTDFISLNDSFISFTEIVTFSSSATLSNYANGATKRLLNTAGSAITITLPAGETYLGSNTIPLAPSIMLTVTKRGTVWVNSSGNAITADRWKTARNITITDADGTNTGTAVSVDGSENETLKLPSTIKATLSGNAGTATKLATPRTINGVSFDGSANITVADSTKSPTSHASSAVTYGVSSEANYGHAKASAVAGSANGTASKGTTPTVFAQSNHVHPLQTSVSGNAGTADKWKTARNITISDADGTNTGTAVSVDGSENETLKLPSTIKATLSGNASTATQATTAIKLDTARKINGVDFDGTADIYDTYSTTEHRIGTWIDGKPWYRKVINFGELPDDRAKSVNHNISNLKEMIRLYGIAQTATMVLPLPYAAHVNSDIITLWVEFGAVIILTGSQKHYYNAIVIIEYTKTTD